MLNEPVRRIRLLRHEEAQRLIAVLPDHLADMASLSLSTGLRAANVTGLQRSQVDLVRRVAWIHPDQAKARHAILVPLNIEAVLRLRRRLGQHPVYVFSCHGKRITQVGTKAWYAALKEACRRGETLGSSRRPTFGHPVFIHLRCDDESAAMRGAHRICEGTNQ